jgi:DNA-directed RNA polymerase specialized sigma24 family protein
MRTEDFNSEIKRLRRALNFFFYEKFRDAGRLSDFKNNVNILIHETAVRAFINYQRPTSKAYKIYQLLFFAAEDVWILFIKPRRKERHHFYEAEKMEAFFGSYELVDQLEAIDYTNRLSTQHDQIVWKLLELHAAGHTYKQIGTLMNIATSTVRDAIIKAQQEMQSFRKLKPPGTKA